MWTKAIARVVATNTTLLANLVLRSERDGDIAAMSLTIAVSLVALVVGLAIFRGRRQVGSLRLWTNLLVVSAVIAPLLGEIGTPIGI